MALGGLQTLGGRFGIMGMFSDRRLKTDIKKIGTHSAGLPIYAYRYKGGQVLSQGGGADGRGRDEDRAPRGAVMTTKGHMAVHMPTLDALGGRRPPPSSPGVGRLSDRRARQAPGSPLQPGIATPPSRSALSP